MSDLVVLYLSKYFFKHPLSLFLLGINTITHEDRHRETPLHDTTYGFYAGTVSAGNETKCGQAEGQVNETAIESVTVFDLPPLIQRDNLIN